MKFKNIWLLFPVLALRAGALGQSPAAEWTFEEALSHWQPMVRPVQHVGAPGYPFQAAVLWDGALVFGPLDFRQLKVMQEEIAPLGDNRLHLSFAYGDPPRFLDRRGSGSPALRRFLELGRLPIPHVVARENGLEWDERVFAHLHGRPLDHHPEPRPDDLLVVQASFTAYNPGPGKRTGRLWMHFGDTSAIQLGYKCVQKEEPAPAIAHRYEAPFGLVRDLVRYLLPKPVKGELRWHDEVPAPAGAGENAAALKEVIEWSVPLDAGERANLKLSIPYGLISRTAAEDLLAADPARIYEAVRKFWLDLEHGPGQIITPDPFVNDYMAAVAGQMAQQVAFRSRSRVWMYKTSPNHYEGYWPCNAAKALPALDFRGLSHLSRPVLQSFVEQQSDDVRGMDKGVSGKDEGLAGEGYAKARGFLGNFGEWTANPLLLSHGLGMWALATHYRVTRDDQWLGSVPGSPLQAMIEAFDWVALQRRRTRREVEGKKVAHWGLLPAASAHDWLAGNTIFNDAFCAYGMAEVVRLLREIHHPRAEDLARELADYRACIHDRYAEARDRARPVPLPDGTAIPYVPRMVQELDWAKLDWTYTGYGPLRAGAWGALDPKDPLVDQALAFLEAGMPKGQGAYFSAHQAALAEAGGRRPAADVNWADISDPQAERHWLWRHYVEYETMWPIGGPLFLARDDLPRFFEWLFHNLAAAIHRDWRVGVESLDGVPSCAPGDGERWQCVRKMFVHEYGGWDGSRQLLGLLQALPRSWLKPGDRLAVRDLPTTFGGRVTLEVNIAPSGNAVRILAEWRDFKALPRAIRMRLRSGNGQPLRSAMVDGVEVKVLEGDLIELPVTESGQHRIVGRLE